MLERVGRQVDRPVRSRASAREVQPMSGGVRGGQRLGQAALRVGIAAQ